MKGCKFYIGMMLLLTAGLLASCSHDAEPAQRTEIAVTTRVAGMQRRAAAVINNNDDLHTYDLKIDAYFHETNVAYLSGVKLRYDDSSEPAEWKFWNNEEPGAQVHYYWPIEGSVYNPSGENISVTSLDFVGFCPYNKPAYIGTPTYNHITGVSFTCDMSTYMTLARQQADFQEFLIAVSPEQTLATQTANDGVPMSFKHPLAQVKFAINAASGTHVQINSIGITATPTSGTCTYNGTDISWGSYGEADTMKIVQTLKVGSARTETTPVFIIPDAGTKYLIVNATWDDWSDVTISNYGTDVDFTWQPGRTYTYNLTLDQYGLKVDSVKYTEQW